jgi:Domain of unknown function (DUF4132)
VVSGIIAAMPDEDIVDIPAGWRDVWHPRRHGVIAAEGPRYGPELSVARAGLGSGGKSLWPLGQLVAERGLAQAVAAFVADCEDDLWEEAARQLRALLAVAPPQVYDEAVAALSLLRDGSPRQRIATSYLVPDRHDWVAADLADGLADFSYLGLLLFYSAATAEQLSYFTAERLGWYREDRLEQFVTAYDVVGNAVAPLIAQWLAQEWWSPDTRRAALEVLTRIPTDEAFGLLLHLAELPDVAGGVLAAGGRFPRRAARMLASRRDGDLIDVLFLRHVRTHPEVPEAALVHRVPDAPADAVPRLLASPPWTRKPPPRVTVTPSPLAAEPRIVWRDGEQEEWAYDWWSAHRQEEMLRQLPLAETGEAPAGFYISAPADVVRPHLATWKAESSRFYFEDPEVIVAKYELDALTPMLRLARGKPAVGAALLMPYLAQEVADLMAAWLTRSRQFRPVAQEWFARHGAHGAALLIPAALGGPPERSRTAALALTRIDADDVLAAAGELGCRAAVEALLGRDPLDIVPAKIPAVPSWADPGFLPPVLLAGRSDALPSGAVAALLRMIAMSSLDAPYEGLRVIAGQCDGGSLSAFAWSLYRLWEAAGRPAKDVWAMNSLGYFGDGTVADRLAPLVRRWPSEGAAPRAKRGADVLAVMGSDRALGHLSAIARNAKSTPLRTHAAAALDRVAADRGLLPEQLDDLLAPDQGPDGSAAYRDQAARLEEAMIVQHRWALGEFQERIAAHPLLGRLARRLVWVNGSTVRLDGLGDLVGPDGAPAGGGEWVRLAHPAVDDFTPWRPWLAGLGAPQPFVQAGREVFAGEDPSAWWQRTVEAAALYRLVRHGWHWGPAGRRALRQELFRPFGAEGRVVLIIDPGVSAVVDAKAEPDQVITELAFESSAGELGVFSDLPLVTRSELIRSLRALG